VPNPQCSKAAIANWKRFTNDIITPFRLPKDPRMLQRLGKVDLSPEASDSGQWWLEWNNTVPYSAEEDRYTEGSIIPSVISLGKLEADRDDVDATATWRDGYWHLEIRRALDTGSPTDIAIATGVYMWVAVFDHSQTRHSYHLRPLRLELTNHSINKQ
jgi:hypothetical protein